MRHAVCTIHACSVEWCVGACWFIDRCCKDMLQNGLISSHAKHAAMYCSVSVSAIVMDSYWCKW